MTTKAFDVTLNGKEIDTVFYSASSSVDAEEVKRSLVGHDGYDAAIEVEARPVSIRDYITSAGITMSSVQVDANPGMDDERGDMSHWRCTLKRRQPLRAQKIIGDIARMTVSYSMGSAHKGEPECADVLDCLKSDAQSVAEDFENWCGDMGYDTDSRKAERTYRACQKIAKQLTRFLGPDRLAALMLCEGL